MAKGKKKVNFAVARSAFGDYWVGKTFLKVGKSRIFSTFDEATEEAMQRTDSVSNTEELQGTLEEECELIEKNCEKWIVS